MTAAQDNANPRFSQSAQSEQKIYAVSDLNQLVNRVLTQQFPLLWIRGEISNFTRAASGHWYFSLKDQRAQVRCVMFRGQSRYLDWQPAEGDEVEARCTVSLYEARGDFQLNIEFMQRAGLGSLYAAFDALKKQLAAEGLFDDAQKKPLPSHPTNIGIVTSSDAAALRDVLSTLKRRMPNVPVTIYPTPVQGKGAADTIAQQIIQANKRAECDVLIVCRGGGSMEDLWQFNEAIVARAIAQSSIPIISGVGHETDFTICDFVADIRAETPTAAAELVSQSHQAIKQQLGHLQRQLNQLMQSRLYQLTINLDHLSKRLVSPKQQLSNQKAETNRLKQRLHNAMAQQLSMQKQQLLRLAQNLQHLNPNAVLTRGYAIVENAQGNIVQSTKQVKTNEPLHITLSEGQLDVKVTQKELNPQKKDPTSNKQSGLFE